MKNSILISFFLLALSSCFRDSYSTLQKSTFNVDGNKTEIHVMYSGCCGCKAFYFNIYKAKKISEQFVVETSCKLYSPTLHLFKTNKNGKVISYKSYTASLDSQFDLAVSAEEKEAFKKLDSIYQPSRNSAGRNIIFSEIKGFKNSGLIHFPLKIKLP